MDPTDIGIVDYLDKLHTKKLACARLYFLHVASESDLVKKLRRSALLARTTEMWFEDGHSVVKNDIFQLTPNLQVITLCFSSHAKPGHAVHRSDTTQQAFGMIGSRNPVTVSSLPLHPLGLSEDVQLRLQKVIVNMRKHKNVSAGSTEINKYLPLVKYLELKLCDIDIG